MQQILDFIRSRQRFAITSHQRPDGDSAGSELALALALEQLGKTAAVFNADPTPEAFGWIPGAGAVRIGKRLEGEWDGVIILECSSFERTGIENLADYFTINIDHHPACPDYADLNWTDPSLAAVGLLVQRLIKGLGVTVTAEIASALYVTVLTDTGSFQHSNTAADTFLCAAHLVSQGADPADIARRVYQSDPLIKMQLL
ncbi:MAG: DHH family phosphoesterase, partial [Acidobacteriota bacterium]